MNKHDCERIQRALHEYIDGTLDSAAIQEVEDHLASCHDCRTMWEETKQVRDLTAGSAPEVPPELHDAIMGRIRREKAIQRARLWRRLGSWASVAGAAVLCVGLLLHPFARQEATNTDTVKPSYSQNGDKAPGLAADAEAEINDAIKDLPSKGDVDAAVKDAIKEIVDGVNTNAQAETIQPEATGKPEAPTPEAPDEKTSTITFSRYDVLTPDGALTGNTAKDKIANKVWYPSTNATLAIEDDGVLVYTDGDRRWAGTYALSEFEMSISLRDDKTGKIFEASFAVEVSDTSLILSKLSGAAPWED